MPSAPALLPPVLAPPTHTRAHTRRRRQHAHTRAATAAAAICSGTSRPTKYSVLLDEAGFLAEQLQRLLYWMCHLQARCTRSVSYPPAVYYEHMLGEQAMEL
jgi:Piwi domain